MLTNEQLEAMQREQDEGIAKLIEAGASPEEASAIFCSHRMELAELTTPRGMIASYRLEKEEARLRQIQRQRLRFLKNGVPERHLLNVFDREPEESEAIAIVKEWLATRETFLAMLSGVGVGKTGAAAYCLIKNAEPVESKQDETTSDYFDDYNHRTGQAIERGDVGHFLVATDLARISGFEATAQWDTFADSPLLVIDDVGAEYVDGKGWSASIVSRLVCERYDACRRTIITSNLTAEQFKAQYGERVADRIRESGRVVTLGGKSRRKAMAKKPSVTNVVPFTKAERLGAEPEGAMALESQQKGRALF